MWMARHLVGHASSASTRDGHREWRMERRLAQGKVNEFFTQLDLHTAALEKEVPLIIKPTVNVSNGTAVHVSLKAFTLA